MYFALFEFLLMVAFVVFMITQFLVPIVRGTPVLPLFRRRRRRLEKQLTAARGTIDDAQAIRQLEELRIAAERELETSGPAQAGRTGSSKFDK